MNKESLERSMENLRTQQLYLLEEVIVYYRSQTSFQSTMGLPLASFRRITGLDRGYGICALACVGV